MGKYQTYSEYKDSEAEWIGNIPTHWITASLSKLFSIKAGGDINTEFFSEEKTALHPYPIYTNANDEKAIYGYTSKSNYLPNTITVSGRGEVGFAAYREHAYDAIIRLLVLTPMSELNGKFFTYFINEVIDFRVESSAIGQLSTQQIAPYKVAFPSFDEQQKIANFLDHEVAKIDTLIEKQQQLIKLLKEKRQAVISHAVTKGLNPDAPMRDSGVEWLGEVPEHWEMVPLKYLCNFSGGGTPSKDNLSYWTGGDIPWVSPKDMKSFWVSDTQDKLTEIAVEESSTNFVEAGALLMVVRSGILQRTIPIAINKVRVTLNQDMKALRFNKRLNVEYAANFILGSVSSLLLEWSKEGATVESIEQEYLSGSLMPVPPKKEQNAINEELKGRMAVFQDLENRAVKGITLLQERRTALISAAVTGKIDVRNWKESNKESIQ